MAVTAGRALHGLRGKKEMVVLHLAEVGVVFPAGTNPVYSPSAQHPLVTIPNSGNAWSVTA